LIEDDSHFNYCLLITSVDLVWIRRAVYAKDECMRWPLSIKRVRFSLSCRSRTPLRTVTNLICKDTGNDLGAIQGRKVDEATRPGQEDPLPLQLRIQSTTPTDKLRNQAIVIQSTSLKITDSPACYTVICFGLARSAVNNVSLRIYHRNFSSRHRSGQKSLDDSFFNEGETGSVFNCPTCATPYWLTMEAAES
jgi:hypothetical protein